MKSTAAGISTARFRRRKIRSGSTSGEIHGGAKSPLRDHDGRKHGADPPAKLNLRPLKSPRRAFDGGKYGADPPAVNSTAAQKLYCGTPTAKNTVRIRQITKLLQSLAGCQGSQQAAAKSGWALGIAASCCTVWLGVGDRSKLLQSLAGCWQSQKAAAKSG